MEQNAANGFLESIERVAEAILLVSFAGRSMLALNYSKRECIFTLLQAARSSGTTPREETCRVTRANVSAIKLPPA